MVSPDWVVTEAWRRAGGAYPPSPSSCECERVTHDHGRTRCDKQLIWGNRGHEGQGTWETHHITASAPDTLSNREILCWSCYRATGTFGG
jgi:hypothetical protein